MTKPFSRLGASLAVTALAIASCATTPDPVTSEQGSDPVATVYSRSAPFQADITSSSSDSGRVPDTIRQDAAPQQSEPSWVEGELLVLADENFSPPAELASVKAGETESVAFGAQTVHVVSFPEEDDRLRVADILASAPGVRAVTPNRRLVPLLHAKPSTNDPLLVSQWSYGSEYADVYSAWALLDALSAERIATTTIAVVDYFSNSTHEDLNMLPGYWAGGPLTDGSPVSTSFSSANDGDHGLGCAGVAGALKGNGRGAAGIVPGVPILPISVARASDGNGSKVFGTELAALRGLRIAAYFNRPDSPYPDLANPAVGPVRVVNFSLGPAKEDPVRDAKFDAAFEFLRSRGILVSVAAGNGLGDGRVEMPATSPAAVAVSVTMHHLGFEMLAPYSNRGEEIWVAGAGHHIWAPGQNNTYQLFNGTSSAAPFVAGVAALINIRYGSGGADQNTAGWTDKVRRRLADTADDLGPPGFDTSYGFGRVNARRAITGDM